MIVTAGDWNSIFDNKLDKCDKSCDGNIVNVEMKSLINSYDLCDVWRTRNNERRRYTYRQKTPLRQSRLDYFLISDTCLDLVSKVDIISSVWSDQV